MEHRQWTVKWPLLLGFTLLVGFNPSLSAGPEESVVKAAFIYNFAKFVEWPADAFASPNAPLQLCVIGRDAVETELRQLEGREAQGRPLHINRINSADEGNGCHILFVAGSESQHQGQILQGLGNASVLTISDRKDFLQQGGVISLYVESQRVQFAVNLPSAQGRGLKLSARLLQLARMPR